MNNFDYTFVQNGKLQEWVLRNVSKNTQRIINKLVVDKGLTIADNTLEKIYHFTENYARQLSDTIIAQSLNDLELSSADSTTNIFLP